MERSLDRREFTLEAALAVLSGVAITISGCGGGGSSPSNPNPIPSTPGDKVGAVGSNHGHMAVITAAQLSAAGAIAIQIRGQANHPHSVSLSSADITAIAGGQRVSRESSNDDAHTHTVTFN